MKEELYDFYGYEYTPYWQTPLFKVVMVFLIFLVIGVITYFFWKKYQNKKSLIKLVAHEWANEELKKLVESDLESKEEFKRAYFKLSEVIKEFFFLNFTWSVQDKTDSELITFLKEKNLLKEHIHLFERFFESIVEIKFADAQTLKEKLSNDCEELKNVFEGYKRDKK